MWIPTAGHPLEVVFIGEEDFRGLKVFTFEMNEQDVDIGMHELAKMPQVLDTSIHMKVEPVSGTTVYSQSLTDIKVVPTPDMKVSIYISNIKFTEDTITDLVDTGKSARTQLLWARVYGFWLVIGLGVVLTVVGVMGLVRARRKEAA